MQWVVGLGATTAAGAAVAVGALLASRRGVPAWFGSAFAAGLLAALVAVDLLPGAAQTGLALGPLAALATSGFVLTWWMFARTARGECCSTYAGRVAATGIAGHGLVEGAVLGLALGLDTRALPLLLVAFVVHKGAEGYALATTLRRSGASRTWPWLALAALAPAAGAVIGPAVVPTGSGAGAVLALLAGALAAVALALVAGARTSLDASSPGTVLTRQRTEVLATFAFAAALAVVLTGAAG